MEILSYGKINLYLNIIGIDENDGYHYIDSIFQEISLYDTIIIDENNLDEDKIIFENINISGNSTVHKALLLFKEKFKINKNYSILINKKIPIGSGLGGGSSNAAYVIKALSKLNNIPLNETKDLFSKIGSDVLFFYYGGLCRVFGKGEKVIPLNSKIQNIYFLVVYPNIVISTKWAYSLINDYQNNIKVDINENFTINNLDFLKKIVYNKFQIFVMNNCKELNQAKINIEKILKKNKLSFMTGSGSSLVYVYVNKEEAMEELDKLVSNTDYKGFLCEPIYHS